MIRNQKVERVHRALRDFLQSKLRPGFALDATPFLIGCDDGNIADKIDDVVGAICRATSGDLTCDVAVPELKRKMKEAVEADGTRKETSSGVDQNVIDRVLFLLEGRLTPSELMAVRQILTTPSKKQQATIRHPEADLGEDAMTKYIMPSQKARDDYAARWPNAAKIKREPTMTPEPVIAADAKRVAPDPAGYAKRFPNAMRIGQ